MSAAAAVAAIGPAPVLVDVVGSGRLGSEIRRLLGARLWATTSSEPPDAVIETTGETAAAVLALERVAPLGIVVLAGPSGATGSLDLYTDLHVRGLVLVGVPFEDE